MMVKCESFMHIDAWFYGLHAQNDKNLFKHKLHSEALVF